MSSFIEGYNYDIFISYRQKDNKGDHWVSEFVEAFKTELESTFKEEISVYFDINPHDGLLETHDVDASLKEKLKCLIFIPIISRTYCDQKSFAWEHEFKAFVEMASNDRFGLKVKLTNGNVAIRVLPIKIHDLEKEDLDLCESIIGGHLRGIEFIYKCSGVNRPLRPSEQKPGENHNRISYRDQINKVSLTVKDIILGMKNSSNASGETISAEKETIKRFIPIKKTLNKNWLYLIIPVLILIATVIFLLPGSIRKSNRTDEATVVAILPFQNLTGDEKNNQWEEGIQSELISNSPVSNSGLIFKPAISINDVIRGKGITNYKGLTLGISKKISGQLGANVFVNGNLTESGSMLRVNAQVVDCKSGDMLGSFSEEGSVVGTIYSITDRLGARIRNFLVISKLKEGVYIDPEEKGSSEDPVAYEYFTYGQKAFGESNYHEAIKLFLQAVKRDSNLIYATLHIGWAYFNLNDYDSARIWCQKVWRRRASLPLDQLTYASFMNQRLFGTPSEEIKYLKQLMDMNRNWARLHSHLGRAYSNVRKYDLAIIEYEKVLEMYKKAGIKPWWASDYTSLMQAYLNTGQYRNEKRLYSVAEKDFPNNPSILSLHAAMLLSEGQDKEAEKYVEKFIKTSSNPKNSILFETGLIYSNAGKFDKAEEFFRKALTQEEELYRGQNHGNYKMLNIISSFFINTRSKIEEGLTIADSILKYNPDNFEALSNKGRALYKQGNYKVAYELLLKSWDLRMQHGIYNIDAESYLDTARMALKNIN